MCVVGVVGCADGCLSLSRFPAYPLPLRGGFAFAGVQYSTECHCGQTFGRYERLPDSACDHPCPGAAQDTNNNDNNNDADGGAAAAADDARESLKCGGYLAQNIYGTGLGRKAENKAELVDPAMFQLGQYKDARIAFVLTLNGRAIRQVQQKNECFIVFVCSVL